MILSLSIFRFPIAYLSRKSHIFVVFFFFLTLTWCISALKLISLNSNSPLSSSETTLNPQPWTRRKATVDRNNPHNSLDGKTPDLPAVYKQSQQERMVALPATFVIALHKSLCSEQGKLTAECCTTVFRQMLGWWAMTTCALFSPSHNIEIHMHTIV